jgi:hypothetical protein
MRVSGWQGVDLRGLSIDDPKSNGVLCNSLARCGLVANGEVDVPLEPRLDWSHADGTSAVGLAFFSALVREFSERRRRYQLVEPTDQRLAAIIANTSGQLGITGEWTTTHMEKYSGNRAECLAATTLARGEKGASDFLDAFTAAAKPHTGQDEFDLGIGCLQELIGNCIEHTASSHSAAVLFRRPTRRPVVIEAGIADCGPGVPATILQQERHRSLASFSDANILNTVFFHAFSGRDIEKGGGGFGLTFGRLADCPATELILRSGCGWLSTTRESDGFKKSRFSYGFGTQASLVLKLSA